MIMKVGILGGTFNPIHNGHIAMAETAYRELGLRKVLFMPTGNPPHKRATLDAQHRCNMIALAIKDRDYFELSDFELKRDGTTYTADTLQLLCSRNPDTAYVFIMGADSFLDINGWYHPEKIFRYARIAVCARDEVQKKRLDTQQTLLRDMYGANVSILDFDCVPISSHDIRDAIHFSKNTESVADMIHTDVAEYIRREGLYV